MAITVIPIYDLYRIKIKYSTSSEFSQELKYFKAVVSTIYKSRSVLNYR